MTGHTPGPWKACEPRFGARFVRQDPSDWNGMGYQYICSLPAEKKGSHYGDMFAANALLIAAAPDLLKAAERLIKEINTRGTHETWKDLANILDELNPPEDGSH